VNKVKIMQLIANVLGGLEEKENLESNRFSKKMSFYKAFVWQKK